MTNPMTGTMTKTFPSQVALDPSARDALVGQLNAHLANTLDLHSQLKQAHWTIKGPQFFARHQLFDAVAEHLCDHADEVAERISTLGGYPRGTVRMVAVATAIAAFDPGHVSGGHLLRDLTERLAMHAATARRMLASIERVDPISADLMTAQIRTLELDMWFFQSHFAE